jgi:heptosyltransferase III
MSSKPTLDYPSFLGDSSVDKALISLFKRNLSPLNPRSLRKVVVYQHKNFGDALLTTPLISAILALNPQIQILIICRSASALLFTQLSKERIMTLGKPRSIVGWLAMAKAVRGSDLLMMPHESSVALFLSRITGVPAIASGNFSHPFLGTPRWRTPKRMTPWRHTAEAQLDLLRHFQIEISERHKRIHVQQLADGECSASVSLALPPKYVVVHPGSRWMFKTPKLKFWIEFIESVMAAGETPILTGMNQGLEGHLLNDLQEATGAINLAGHTSLEDLVKVIKGSAGYAGVDTFATHVAAGLSIRGIVLFGPTSEALWGPFGSQNRLTVISDDRFACRPCHQDGCGGGKLSDCLNGLHGDAIARRFLSVIHQCE